MSSNILLKAALKYQSMGFSVIPVRQNKKPYISWQSHQTERATDSKIQQWWEKWPSANIGIVTGKVSGVDVIDTDSEDGWDALNQFLSENFETPISKTPKGRHVFFRHKAGLSNGVRVLKDCDLRTTGGYVVVHQSNNGNGKSYIWTKGLTTTDLNPQPMPDMLFDILKSGAVTNASAHARAYINKKAYTSKRRNTGPQNGAHNKPQQGVTLRNIGFQEGQRDESVFHLANHLVKGGMLVENIEDYLRFFALHCSPPFPEKEIPIKIESALKRAESRDRNLTQEIREWINITNRNFSVTFLWQAQQIVTKEDKAKVRTILNRFVKDGLIEKTDQAGVYRKIQSDCEPQDWQNASDAAVDLWLPFGLDNIAVIPPGAIILVAGEPNAGKTAFLLNIARENMRKFNTHYFSSEMSKGAFKRRAEKFPDITANQWDVKFYERTDNFVDVIKGGVGNLNIIDFLEIYENFYLVSKHLADIYKKLKGAIAVVALQKNPGQDDGRGGTFTREKPILSIALSPGKAKITKLKEWNEAVTENPNRMEYYFKLVDGCRFIKTQGWHRPIE
jgi:hypothetical protein